jgi:hypothetical protein
MMQTCQGFWDTLIAWLSKKDIGMHLGASKLVGDEEDARPRRQTISNTRPHQKIRTLTFSLELCVSLTNIGALEHPLRKISLREDLKD